MYRIATFVVCISCAWALIAQVRPDVPSTLDPPTNEKLLFQAHAQGDQVYACGHVPQEEGHFQWVLSAPDAKLFDGAGKQIGTHFAGPTWRASDGSEVTGKVIASNTADPDSIPWLLLAATGHERNGLMSSVSSIQRLDTKAGKAPGMGCDSSHQGEKTRVHYTADYYFYSTAK